MSGVQTSGTSFTACGISNFSNRLFVECFWISINTNFSICGLEHSSSTLLPLMLSKRFTSSTDYCRDCRRDRSQREKTRSNKEWQLGQTNKVCASRSNQQRTFQSKSLQLIMVRQQQRHGKQFGRISIHTDIFNQGARLQLGLHFTQGYVFSVLQLDQVFLSVNDLRKIQKTFQIHRLPSFRSGIIAYL